MYVHNDDVTYFDSFGVEHIPKKVREFIYSSQFITTNILRIQANDSKCADVFVLDLLILCLQESP